MPFPDSEISLVRFSNASGLFLREKPRCRSCSSLREGPAGWRLPDASALRGGLLELSVFSTAGYNSAASCERGSRADTTNNPTTTPMKRINPGSNQRTMAVRLRVNSRS